MQRFCKFPEHPFTEHPQNSHSADLQLISRCNRLFKEPPLFFSRNNGKKRPISQLFSVHRSNKNSFWTRRRWEMQCVFVVFHGTARPRTTVLFGLFRAKQFISFPFSQNPRPTIKGSHRVWDYCGTGRLPTLFLEPFYPISIFVSFKRSPILFIQSGGPFFLTKYYFWCTLLYWSRK